MSFPYKLPSSAVCGKEGLLYLYQEEKNSLKKFYCVTLFVCTFFYRVFAQIRLHMRTHKEMEMLFLT